MQRPKATPSGLSQPAAFNPLAASSATVMKKTKTTSKTTHLAPTQTIQQTSLITPINRPPPIPEARAPKKKFELPPLSVFSKKEPPPRKYFIFILFKWEVISTRNDDIF